MVSIKKLFRSKKTRCNSSSAPQNPKQSPGKSNNHKRKEGLNLGCRSGVIDAVERSDPIQERESSSPYKDSSSGGGITEEGILLAHLAFMARSSSTTAPEVQKDSKIAKQQIDFMENMNEKTTNNFCGTIYEEDEETEDDDSF